MESRRKHCSFDLNVNYMDIFIKTMECTVNLLLATGISCSYVGLLYAFDFNGVDRDHPRSIKRRFLAAVVNNVASVSITYFLLSKKHADPLEVMGIHTHGMLSALVLPAVLTSVCYLGSWTMTYIDGHIGSLFDMLTTACSDLSQWLYSFSSLMWIRDTVMAPLTEELAFRACTATLVLECMSPMSAVFTAPLPFALSHLHHVFNDMKRGQSKQEAILHRVFQAAYSYLFGAYATFLFVRTGTILAAIVSHSICNNMGLPMFQYIRLYPQRSTRVMLWCSYIIGFVAWLYLLMPMTTRSLYA